MNWRNELNEKQSELAEIQSKIKELKQIEKEMKAEIKGIENMIILENNWSKAV